MLQLSIFASPQQTMSNTREITIIRNLTVSGYTIRTSGIDLDSMEDCFGNVVDYEDVNGNVCSLAPSSTFQESTELIAKLIYFLQRNRCNSLIGKNEVDSNDYQHISYPYRSEFFKQGITNDISKTLQAKLEYKIKLYGKVTFKTDVFLKESSQTMQYQMRKYLEEVGDLKPATISRCLSILTVKKHRNLFEVYDSDDNLLFQEFIRNEEEAGKQLLEVLTGCAGSDNVQKILFYGWNPSKMLAFNIDLITSHENTVVYVGDVKEASESTTEWFQRNVREMCGGMRS